MKNFYLLLISLFASVGLASCGSSKPSTRTAPVDQSVSSGVSLQGRYQALTSAYREDWTTVKLPVSVEVRKPKDLSLSGQLTVVRGQGMTLSMRVLGFEAANVTLLGDSVYAVLKVPKKIYVAESVSQLLAGFPATQSNVESLLLGHLFLLGKAPLTASSSKGYTLAEIPGGWSLTADQTPAGVSYRFNVADGLPPELKTLEVNVGTRKMAIGYDGWTATDAGPAAEAIALSTSLNKAAIDASLTLNYSGATWNKSQTIKRPSTKGYTRMKSSDIIKILSKF